MIAQVSAMQRGWWDKCSKGEVEQTKHTVVCFGATEHKARARVQTHMHAPYP